MTLGNVPPFHVRRPVPGFPLLHVVVGDFEMAPRGGPRAKKEWTPRWSIQAPMSKGTPRRSVIYLLCQLGVRER